VALNPVIKFTTLFGLLAVELAVQLTATQGSGLTHILAARILRGFVLLRVSVVLRECAFAKTQLTEDWFWCSDFRSNKEGGSGRPLCSV